MKEIQKVTVLYIWVNFLHKVSLIMLAYFNYSITHTFRQTHVCDLLKKYNAVY